MKVLPPHALACCIRLCFASSAFFSGSDMLLSWGYGPMLWRRAALMPELPSNDGAESSGRFWAYVAQRQPGLK